MQIMYNYNSIWKKLTIIYHNNNYDASKSCILVSNHIQETKKLYIVLFIKKLLYIFYHLYAFNKVGI